MASGITEAGVTFYSICGATIEVRWEGKGGEEEIEQLFTPFHLTKLSCPNNSVIIELKLTTSDIPSSIPYPSSEALSCYDLSIFEEGERVFLTDGLSIFQVQPQEGTGLMTLHRSFREKPLLSKYNFFLIGLIYLLSQKGFYDLHAAGLIRNGIGVLLLGESGSGKSSLSLSLVHQGWHYLSDDALLLKASLSGVEAFGFRKKFYLDSIMIRHYSKIASYIEELTNGDNIKRFLDLEMLYPDRFMPSCFPKVLIYTHIVPQPESKLIPIDKASALIKLMKQSASLFFNRQAVKVHLEVLKKLIYQTSHYQLLAGRDLYEQPWNISEILSEAVGI